MPNPHNYTKNSLLGCIEILNKVGELDPPIKVRTKALPQVLEKTAEALKQVNHFQLTENTPQETLEELVCWGLLDIGFLGQVVPPELLVILEKFTDKTTQAPEMLEFDDTHLEANMARIKEQDGKVSNTEEGVGGKFYEEGGASAGEKFDTDKDALIALIAELTKDLAKAEAKGKAKKIAKITAGLDEANKALANMEVEVKKKKDKPAKANPRIAEINEEIKMMQDNMPAKKKKAKKVQAKIDELNAELAAIWDASTGMGDTDAEPKSKKDKSKDKAGATTSAPSRGANARASRVIPTTISWPNPDSITGTIVSFCQKKPRTIAEILGKLEKSFPDRAIAGMTKTVGALVGGKGLPLPLHYTKGIPCEVEHDGTPQKTIFIPVSE